MSYDISLMQGLSFFKTPGDFDYTEEPFLLKKLINGLNC